jgi:WD40 repeat protein
MPKKFDSKSIIRVLTSVGAIAVGTVGVAVFPEGFLKSTYSAFAGIAGNLFASDLHTWLRSRLKTESILRNHDLSRICGESIRYLIIKEAESSDDTFLKKRRKRIVAFAEKIPIQWEELVLNTSWMEKLSEVDIFAIPGLLLTFDSSNTNDTSVSSLDPDSWFQILAEMNGITKSRLTKHELGIFAHRIHREYPVAVRELLRRDDLSYRALEMMFMRTILDRLPNIPRPENDETKKALLKGIKKLLKDAGKATSYWETQYKKWLLSLDEDSIKRNRDLIKTLDNEFESIKTSVQILNRHLRTIGKDVRDIKANMVQAHDEQMDAHAETVRHVVENSRKIDSLIIKNEEMDLDRRTRSVSKLQEFSTCYQSQYRNQTLSRQESPIVESIFWADRRNHVSLSAYRENGENIDDLDKELIVWATQDQGEKQLAILGDYGTGKTSSALKLIDNLLKDPSAPFPVYISIRDISDRKDASKEFHSILSDRFGIKIHDANASLKQIDRTSFLLILDGLDEICDVLDSSEIKIRLSKIARFFPLFKKVLALCRASYFPAEVDLASVLPVPGATAQLVESLYHIGSYSLLFVKGFSHTQQCVFIDSVSPKHAERLKLLIFNLPSLKSLSTRPVLLNMIVRTLGDGTTDPESINISNLYKQYTSAWLESEKALGRSPQLRIEQKKQLLQNLAFELHIQKTNMISRFNFLDLIDKWKAFFGISERLDFSLIEYDFLTCSFLQRTYDNYFGFAHKSFMEYFVARKIVNDLLANSIESLNCTLTGSVVPMLAEVMNAEKDKAVLIEKVRSFLTSSSQDGYLKSNCASLLCRLGVDMSGIAVCGSKLYDSDLTNGIFADANFEDTDFSNCNLTSTNFRGANLRRTTLNNVFIHKTNFHKSTLAEASLWNIRLVGGPVTIWASCFISDDSIAIGTSDGFLSIINICDSQIIKQRKISASGVLHCSFCARTGKLAVSDRSAKVYVYERGGKDGMLESAALTLDDQNDNVRWTDFDPSTNWLACGCRDGILRIWKLDERNELLELSKHQRPIMSSRWSPDNSKIVTAGYDGSAFIWDPMRSGQGTLISDDASLQTHAGIVRNAIFTGNDECVATIGEDGFLKVWDVSRPKKMFKIFELQLSERLFSIEFLNADYVLVGGESGRLFVCSLVRREVERILHSHTDFVRSIARSKSGSVITSSWDGIVLLWDMSNGESKALFNVHALAQPLTSDFSEADMSGITGISDRMLDYLRKFNR